ncbi:MAG TPA: lipopolysaccharide heptosyltransferase II [Casimicrobiaceae bacterium]|nr:lipopolysaccharide heptosyltransferase II [Casimicrobiaceae bacterium]
MSAAQWARARAVLAVRLDGMGDLLMSTPALRALKAGAPGRTLTLLCSPAGACVARALPFVDDVIEYRAPWMKHPDDAGAAAHTLALVGTLRERRFDAAVVLTVFTQSALPAALALLLAGVPLRAAYCRENPYQLLTDWQPEQDLDARTGVRHEVQRQLDLVAALGASTDDTSLAYPVPLAARAAAQAWLARTGVAQERLLVVHPGATAPSRRYPVDALADAVAELAEVHGYAVVIAGGAEDCAAARQIHARVPQARDLCGALTLDELAALIEAAAVLVANNSLAAHLAAAVGTPVVDLYALTNPQHTPWGVRHRVLNHDVECRFCFKSVCPERHHRCLAAVAPSQVVDAVCELARDGGRDAPADGAARRASVAVAA